MCKQLSVLLGMISTLENVLCVCMIDSSPYDSLWEIYLKRERNDKQDILTHSTVSYGVSHQAGESLN